MKKFLLTSLILPCLFLNSGCQESECGDGVLEGEEECDGKQLSKTCQDFGFVQGEPTCDELTCKINTITCKNSDIECGNGFIEGNEQCDGQATNNATCPDGSPRSCDDSCSFVPCGNTPQPVCGNNIKEQGEQCDGNSLGLESCKTKGFSTGYLKCTFNCKLDTSMCSNNIEKLITIPKDGDTIYTTNPNISGQASPGDTIYISIDQNHIGSLTADNNGLWSFAIFKPLSYGLHTVTASAVGISHSIKFTIAK